MNPPDDNFSGQKPFDQRHAIAMWDFSWILRHHRLGEFEDWNKVLDELCERGYDSLRIDAMPHLIAPGETGEAVEEFSFPQESWKPALWGNAYSTKVRPREDLVNFLTQCYKRNIRVVLSSWFVGPFQPVKTCSDLVRVWDETLRFLQQHNLLGGILYVDVANEYPFWNGLSWMRKDLDKMAKRLPESSLKDTSEVHIPDMANMTKNVRLNSQQRKYVNGLLEDALSALRRKWPLPFTASFEHSTISLDEDIDLSLCDVLDYHIWFNHHPVSEQIQFSHLQEENDQNFEALQRSVDRSWGAHESEIIFWMGQKIAAIGQAARLQGIPCGNTEGWGPILWQEHPALSWEWVKECGNICVDLAIENGYHFICTSNFTHPQFRSLWRDIDWHKSLCAKIRSTGGSIFSESVGSSAASFS